MLNDADFAAMEEIDLLEDKILVAARAGIGYAPCRVLDTGLWDIRLGNYAVWTLQTLLEPT